MGNRFSTCHQTPAAADKGIVNLTGSAAIRCEVFDLILGSDATPGDQAGLTGSIAADRSLDPSGRTGDR